MIICPDCKHNNLEGTLFCEECGSPFLSKAAVVIAGSSSTTTLGSEGTNTLSPDAQLSLGRTTLGPDTTVIFHLKDTNERVRLALQSEIVLGRADERLMKYPDIDLTPHGALEKGVSRSHAALRRNDDHMTIVDLGSANGTFVNGRQVYPNQPHIVRDGDEIRLGKLTSIIYFAKEQEVK